MKKTFKWLKENEIDFVFHDYRKDGLTEAMLISWEQSLGFEALINKRGTTWRKLSDDEKQNINSKNAIQLMLNNEAMIKRPLLIHNKQITLGFKAETYQNLFL